LEGLPEKPGRTARMSEVPDTSFSQERARANAALIRRMADGDRDALAELYDRLSGPFTQPRDTS
jgi:hypothetical protein